MADNPHRFNQLTEKLRQRGYRMTPQRLALIRLIAASQDHPGAAELFASVKAMHPTMSLATVYKTIELLKELNEIIEINLQDVSHYDGSKPYSHPHFICNSCHIILDGELGDSVSQMVHQVEQSMKFKVQKHQLNFYGLCSACQDKMSVETMM